MSFVPGFMFGSGGRWSPLQKSPYLDLIGDTGYLTTGTGGVVTWEDLSPQDTNPTQSDSAYRPDYNATGWSGSQSTVDFSASPYLSATAGATIITALSGTDVPFTMLATLDPDAVKDMTICAWDSTTGNAYSICRFDSPDGINLQLRYDRRDDGGGAAVITNTPGTTGSGHLRLAIVFDGSSVALYVGGALAASAACNVGACTFDRFRVGTGPGAIDALEGKVKHLDVSSVAYTAADVALYQTWSVATFGS